MRRLHPEISKAVDVAARFGFISQEIFFNFVTTRKRTMAYFIWSKLIKTKYFERYNHSTISSSYLKLSAYGKSQNDLHGEFLAMPAPSPQQLSHDEILVKFALHNEKKGLFECALPESYSKNTDVMFARHFMARHLKFPDLRFELGGPNKKFNVALELERTRKSNARYQTNLLSYSVHEHVDLVLFVTSHESIEGAIKEAALKINYPFDKKPVAFAKTSDFVSNPSFFPLLLNNKLMRFEDLVWRLSQKMPVAV